MGHHLAHERAEVNGRHAQAARRNRARNANSGGAGSSACAGILVLLRLRLPRPDARRSMATSNCTGNSGGVFWRANFFTRAALHLPYPPFWAMAHAPAALLSMPVAKALLFPVGVAALLFLLRLLRSLAGPAFRPRSDARLLGGDARARAGGSLCDSRSGGAGREYAAGHADLAGDLSLDATARLVGGHDARVGDRA